MFARLRLLREAHRKNAWLKQELALERVARQKLQTEGRQQHGEHIESVRAENLIWIFGAARTGSTWLSRMLSESKGHYVWNEPLVGALFGNLYYKRAKHRMHEDVEHYILGEAFRESWLDSIRAFVLKEASVRFPEAAGPDNYLIIKEPNGSLGAPLLLEALPESRMILLVRDPRDVVASSMDARREGGWNNQSNREQKPLMSKGVDSFVSGRAKDYLQRIQHTKQAYDAHQGCKVLVRYEELRADTLGTMRRIRSTLKLQMDENELS